ncbi:MAG: hypothetical protein Q8M02_08795, partial [Candidatus Didemnitutus sp.]|nr:hypothetical protein [Candidatus Didemnitutus sp.]
MITFRSHQLSPVSRRLMVGALLFTLPLLGFAQSLTWQGNSTGSWATGTNFAENQTPGGPDAPYNIIIAPTAPAPNGNLVATILAGGNYTIRSLTVNNSTGFLGNIGNTTGLRIASASNANVALNRTITFGTPSITIINATNNIA